ncbi:SprT-like domain-containing protein [Flavobacteriales bacterium]|nr:SprT-like domain-containing protein [Flavobacteriales bacterium]
MDALKVFLPVLSLEKINDWINELDVKIRVVPPRKTKLGDFKVIKDSLYISVNNDLNLYSFLITLTHELAHAFVYVKHKRAVAPHGSQWQKIFQSMMLNFLNPKIFPNDLLKALSVYLKQPKASTLTDINLAAVLKKYDRVKVPTISDIANESIFSTSNGRIFKKGKQLRKHYKCIECTTNKVYLFHPFAEVTLIQ